jgi:hypothetical protein
MTWRSFRRASENAEHTYVGDGCEAHRMYGVMFERSGRASVRGFCAPSRSRESGPNDNFGLFVKVVSWIFLFTSTLAFVSLEGRVGDHPLAVCE